MERIESWSEQISKLEKLKINEAQQLYEKALETSDEKLKKLYIDKIILGTLYVVENFVERNNLTLLQNSNYDSEDLLGAFTEIWIKKINDGELLKVDKFSYMFSSGYFNEVYNNLVGGEIIVHEQFGVPTEIFVELFYSYIRFKNIGKNINFKDLVDSLDNDYYSWRLLSYSHEYLLNIFEKMYDNLSFDKNDDLELTKKKITDFLRLIINSGMFEPLSNDIEADDMENIILDKMVYKAFVCDVDNVLTDDRRRGVIHQRFGLDDDNQKSLEEVGKYYNVTRERVRQMEAKVIRILAGSPKIKKYNGGN